jgi:SAM-dependent methyltransferase
MTSDEGGSAAPDAGMRAREYTHFAEPAASEPAASEPATYEPATYEPATYEPATYEPATSAPQPDADWSQPTLSRHAEAAAAMPQASATEPLPDAETPPPIFERSFEADVPEPVRDAAPPVAEEPPVVRQAPVESMRETARNYYVPPIATRRPRVSYQPGSVPSGHRALVEQTADAAVSAMPIPLRVLDVGCGEGLLLAELILRVPYAESYVGLDPLPDLVPDQLRASDPRVGVVRGAAESLPFAGASFDLVIAMLSFTYWKDQRAGLAELARVVADNGKVVVVEPTNGTDGRAHGAKKIGEMLAAAGLTLERTETLGRSRLGRASARAFVAAP